MTNYEKHAMFNKANRLLRILEVQYNRYVFERYEEIMSDIKKLGLEDEYWSWVVEVEGGAKA